MSTTTVLIRSEEIQSRIRALAGEIDHHILHAVNFLERWL